MTERAAGRVPVRVIIADDEPIVRAGISMLLAAVPDIEVVAEASDGAQTVALAAEHEVDVVVMDVRMPRLDGIVATQRIVAEGARSDQLTKVLVLTTFDDDDAVLGALRAGASGFLLKFAAPRDLVDAVRRVAAGDSWLDPRVTGRVIAALAPAAPTTPSPPPRNPLLDRLTPREQEVLLLVAEGLSNQEICARFVLSEATVKTHVSRVLMKTGSRDRAQAVALAYLSGLAPMPPGAADAAPGPR